MRISRSVLTLLALAVSGALLAGCAQSPGKSPQPEARASTSDSPLTAPSPSATAAPSSSTTPSPTRTRRTRRARPADPRWAFFTPDRRRHRSPWFPGRHRKMIGFGCTEAPYYDPDPSCPGGEGFHHGIDVAIPCGTPLRAGRRATVLPHESLGSAYGENPVLLRVDGRDVVIGHTRKVYVDVGDQLAPGQRFARVSDAGAPDGCHLHFEVRRAGGGVSDAVPPGPLLGLRSSPPSGDSEESPSPTGAG